MMPSISFTLSFTHRRQLYSGLTPPSSTWSTRQDVSKHPAPQRWRRDATVNISLNKHWVSLVGWIAYAMTCHVGPERRRRFTVATIMGLSVPTGPLRSFLWRSLSFRKGESQWHA